MTNTEFTQLLQKASNLAFEFAKNYVTDELPDDFKYAVELNISNDNPNLTQFDVYPDDYNIRVAYISANEAAALLCRNNKVPVWIDISVEAVHKKKTVLNLLCAGRYSDDENEFYYRKNDTGPFGIKSPVFPVNYIEGEKFELKVKPNKLIISWLLRNIGLI